jgi:hypothetical protein
MTKEKQVIIKMDTYTAVAVRQILFESQKGYTYEEQCVPSRISNIRNIIKDIDDNIGAVLGI